MVLTTDRHHEITPPAQDLIPEVRLRTRRRRLRVGLLALIFLVVVLLMAGGGVLIGRTVSSTTSPPSSRRGSVVTSSTLGPSTTIGDVQMQSAQRGVAVAYAYVPQSSPTYYLVSTSDAARTWHVVAPLGRDGRVYFSPTLHFVNSLVGYVSFASPPRIEVTVDGGLTWRRLTTTAPGIVENPISFAVLGNTATTVWTSCVQGVVAQYCHSWIEMFRVGATSPLSRHAIPDYNGNFSTERLLDVTPSNAIFIVSSSGQLHESLNAGLTWRTVATPCAATSGSSPFVMAPAQFTTFAKGNWLLGCAVGTGMMHENTSLWSSPDHGATWHNLAYNAIAHPEKGNLLGEALSFVWSNDHRILYTLWQGAISGVGWTSNGTQWHWTLDDSVNAGYEAFLSPFDSHGAIYSSPVDVLAATSNGSSWNDLRSEMSPPTRITAGQVVVETAATTAKS